MRVRVLGEIDVVVDGRPVDVTSRNQRIVLAVLAAHAGTTVSADVLIDAVWGERPPRTAVTTLRTYVSRLRRTLGEQLSISTAGYALDLDAEDLDVTRFERLLDRAGTEPPADAVRTLDEAIALWRGQPFGDVADLAVLRASRAQLAELDLRAREERAIALLSSGRLHDAIAAAEEITARQPLREPPWIVLIDALAATGRTPEALRAYQRAAAALAEAGLEATPALRRAEADALAEDQPAPEARPLAAPRSSLVGRDDERAAIAALLQEHRLVTLVGPGGVGKTRLAHTVAEDLQHRFAWGARFVELAGVEDGNRVLDVVAGELGLTVDADGPAAALSRAGQLDLLAVLDNCEHLVDDAAVAVDALARGGVRIKVLCTSREALGIDGEQVWPVTPLPAEDAAAELFIERARAARPDFRPDAAGRTLISDVVEHLDGLPLAIEMAAASLRTLPLRELARRLESELGLPRSRRRAVEGRHRTLADLVEWSTRLLDDEDLHLLRSMTVFAGSVDEEDVAAVTGDPAPLESLCRLAERSLLVADTTGSRARFRMLRTVRQVLRQHLDADRESTLRAAHARWAADAVHHADGVLRTAQEREGHERIEQLLDDLRAAVVWALDHDPSLAVRIAGSLHVFGQSRLRWDVLGWAAEIVERLTDPTGHDGCCLLLVAAAQHAVSVGDLDRGRSLADTAIAAGTGSAQALAFEQASDVCLFSGELSRAAQLAREGLAVARRSGDPHAAAMTLSNLVLASAYAGDHDQAQRDFEAGPGIELQAPSDLAWLRYVDGERRLDREPDAALAALDEAITLATSVHSRFVESVARVSIASLRSRAGDPGAARAAFADLVGHWRRHGDQTHLLTTLRNLVTLFHRLDQPEAAALLLGSVFHDEVAPTFGAESDRLAESRRWVDEALGAEEARRHLVRGRAMTIDDAALAALTFLRESNR